MLLRGGKCPAGRESRGTACGGLRPTAPLRANLAACPHHTACVRAQRKTLQIYAMVSGVLGLSGIVGRSRTQCTLNGALACPGTHLPHHTGTGLCSVSYHCKLDATTFSQVQPYVYGRSNPAAACNVLKHLSRAYLTPFDTVIGATTCSCGSGQAAKGEARPGEAVQ